MKTVIINISEEALKDIMDIQSRDGMGLNTFSIMKNYYAKSMI